MKRPDSHCWAASGVVCLVSVLCLGVAGGSSREAGAQFDVEADPQFDAEAGAEAGANPVLRAPQEPRPGIGRVVERIQARYQDIGDLRARFVQRRLSRMGSVQIEAQGWLYVRPPGRMRWEYDDEQLFVADGDEMYLYLPDDNQVQVIMPERADTSQMPVLYLAGRGNLVRDFDIETTTWGVPLRPGNLQLSLLPRRPDTSFGQLILEVEPISATIYRLVTIDALGNTIDYQFHEIEFDVGLPDTLFEFVIPAGADVMYIGG